MGKPNKKVITNYLNAIKNSRLKYITADDLSEIIGVYPAVIIDNLVHFEPMINIDIEYNLVDIVPAMEQYIEKKPAADKKIAHTQKGKKEKLPYNSISQFIRDKMTFGGMFDTSAQLSNDDLVLLKKLIVLEQNKLKKKK